MANSSELQAKLLTLIEQVIGAHPSLCSTAMRQKAHIEHWLKWELAQEISYRQDMTLLGTEMAYAGGRRCDTVLQFDGDCVAKLELKTCTTNHSCSLCQDCRCGGQNITQQIASVKGDCALLASATGDPEGLSLFLLYPIPDHMTVGGRLADGAPPQIHMQRIEEASGAEVMYRLVRNPLGCHMLLGSVLVPQSC